MAGWTWSTAALELVLPLPDGLAIWPELNARILAADIPAHFRRGAGAMVLPATSRLPLVPLPASDWCMIVALRPRASRARARAFVPVLRDIASHVLRFGGSIYMMGVEQLDATELALQYGDALHRWVELKAKYDPHWVCNPGLLEPVGSSQAG